MGSIVTPHDVVTAPPHDVVTAPNVFTFKNKLDIFLFSRRFDFIQ